MIPDIPQIRDSLAELTIKEMPSIIETERQKIICTRLRRSDLDYLHKVDGTVIALIQGQQAPMTLSRIIERVGEELHKQEHEHARPKSDPRVSLASKILGLSVAFGPYFSNPLEALNRLLARVSDASVTQWAGLAAPSTGTDQYRFGEYSYGEVDLSVLRSRCEKAGSDYFVRYGTELRGRQAICRDSRHIKALDIAAFEWPDVDASCEKMTNRIIDDYYADLAEAQKREFLIDLDRQQAIFGAAGLGTVSANFLMGMSALTRWITIFTRQERRHGWVVPNQTIFEIWTNEPKAMAEGHNKVTKHLKLQDWQQRPFDPWI